MSSLLYRMKQNIYKRSGSIFGKNNYSKYHITNMPSVISSNCIGGVVYHNLGLQFSSPTINMFIYPDDFLNLVQHLEDYMQIEPLLNEFESQKCGFPVMTLKNEHGEVSLYCIHYESFEIAKQKWNERKKRIDYNRIIIIMTDRDGFSESNLKQFEELQYPKVLYSSKKLESDNSVFVKAFKNKGQVGIMTDYCDIRGLRFFEAYFDIYSYCDGQPFDACIKSVR